ncbi:sn-glycerol-3-phosphate ABC transporter ATP-binding protein UgpC [Candidatus Dependentiae bacterium]|nr:sn-glycerol-3-phosphate ABC transporter ATP-binding protein UgpC [Candidatus Dependentiae bacterium]
MATVTFKNISKTYENKVQVVKNISLEIKDKEFLILVGPSGCGKSTSLRMIAGLEEITSGELYIGDTVVNNVPPKDRDIAMVFQNYALYPHMTVYENMAFGLKLRKFPKSEIDKRVKESAEILGLTHLLDRKPKALSGGQRQRVAVGRAIVRQPKVFLFDEPLSNLDAKLRVQMRAELSKLHKRLQATMVYVTHDQVEAMTMGDRIAVMNGGIIQQCDTPLNLYHFPANKFVAGFIGSPSMNFLECSVISKNGAIYLEEGNGALKVLDKTKKILEKDYVGKKVILGIRPEDIYDKLFTPAASSDHTLRAMVEVVEPMGAEIYCHFATKKHNIVTRFKDEKPEVGAEVDLVFNMDKIHLFDVETEKVIK